MYMFAIQIASLNGLTSFRNEHVPRVDNQSSCSGSESHAGKSRRTPRASVRTVRRRKRSLPSAALALLVQSL